MADYWISFRIAYDNDASYDRRYNKLIEAIDQCTDEPKWETNTSFVTIRSSHSIATIGLHLAKAIDARQDHIVLRQIDYKNTAVVGSPGDNFWTFFPDAKQL